MPDLGSLITDFLRDAESGGVYTREQLRVLRGGLAHVVASDLGTLEVDAVRGRHVQTMVAELRAAGVPAARVSSIIEALRPVFAYAIGRGLVRSSPLVGLAPTGRDTRSPTAAMVALGEQIVAWTVRVILIAFVLMAAGLVVALA